MVLALLGLVVLASCNANTGDIDELKKGQKEILEKLANLEKSVQQVKAPAAPGRPSIDPGKVYDIPLANSPVRGPKDAKVTLVEFSDFQCPFCAQSSSLVDQLMKEYPRDLRFVYKEFPLPATMHPQALPASKAALAAGKQGKFWEMHDILFQNQRALSPENMKDYARQIGVNVARWEQDLASPDLDKEINDDLAVGRAADVSGTPTFFIAGKRVMNRSVEGMKQMVEDALHASK